MSQLPSRRRTALRWAGRVGVALVALLAVAAGSVYALSERKLAVRRPVTPHRLVVPTDSATVARGRRLATVRGCTDCHGTDFRGNTVLDDPAVGTIAGPNLTAGGRGPQLDDAAWELAVRHGVRPDGTPLLVMPANEFNVLTDEDLAAIVAYARSVPADTHTTPRVRLGPVIRTMYAAGKVNLLPATEIAHARPHAATIVADSSVAYGAYLTTGCTGCHNPSFSGGPIVGAPPDWKPAANLTPTGIGHYREADFFRALREGKRPDGSRLDALMNVAMTSQFTDTELKAMFAYLRTLPPKPYAVR